MVAVDATSGEGRILGEKDSTFYIDAKTGDDVVVFMSSQKIKCGFFAGTKTADGVWTLECTDGLASVGKEPSSRSINPPVDRLFGRSELDMRLNPRSIDS